MSDSQRILVVHGPNLNLLGQREPETYGHATLADIDRGLTEQGRRAGFEIDCMQSNHEGVLIDRIQQAMGVAAGILINPAGFTHSSVAIRDALAATALPVVEVHLSNVFVRESFRHHSYVSGVALGVISGLGADGYRLGLEALMARVRD